jgi:predicted kinase
LKEGTRDVVLDFSFWNREFRDEWRDVIKEETEEGKVKVLIVFFDAEEEVLWRRIEERRRLAQEKGREADNAALVTRAMLSRYVRGFERPEEDEEGIIVVKVE